MHVLYRKLNYRNIKLTDDCSGQTVGVRCRDGSHQYVLWLGFIQRREAVRLRGRAVKLVVSRVDGRDLVEGEYVQGCLLSRGVYGVIDSDVAIVR